MTYAIASAAGRLASIQSELLHALQEIGLSEEEALYFLGDESPAYPELAVALRAYARPTYRSNISRSQDYIEAALRQLLQCYGNSSFIVRGLEISAVDRIEVTLHYIDSSRPEVVQRILTERGFRACSPSELIQPFTEGWYPYRHYKVASPACLHTDHAGGKHWLVPTVDEGGVPIVRLASTNMWEAGFSAHTSRYLAVPLA